MDNIDINIKRQRKKIAQNRKIFAWIPCKLFRLERTRCGFRLAPFTLCFNSAVEPDQS